MPTSTKPTPPPPRIDAPLERLQLLDRLRRAHAAQQTQRAAGYRTDPVGWAWDRLGIMLWSKQAAIAESVVRNRRTAVRSSHGVGKTLLAAVLACWWLDTHPRDTAMVISTAPSYDQVHGVLWEYIRSIHARAGLQGTVQRSDRWISDSGKLIGFGRRPPDHSSDAFQGYHEDNLVIVDEAGGIPEWLWNSTEALTSGDECRILAIGNPTDSASHFAKLRGSSVWATQQISTFDTPRFTGEIDTFPAEIREEMRRALPSPQWAADALTQWGEHSSLYRVRVLGEFADRDDGLIPLSWVSQANLRWTDWHDAGAHEPGGRRVISVDPAWLGEDQTAMAIREADIIREVRRWSKMDTTQTTALIENELLFPRSTSVVDVVGVGAGVVDQLRAHHRPVHPFNGAMATRRRDATGQWRFRNCLTEDARVRPVGDLRRIYRTPYQGPLFEVETAGGDHFTATANHQILTRSGWVPAQALNVGDQLVNTARAEPAPAGRARPEVDDVPPELGEVYRAAARLFGAERVHGAAVNFHGDRPAGEVEVVTVDRDLLTVDPSGREQAEDLDLVRRLVAQRLLPPEGAPVSALQVRGRNTRERAALPGDGVPGRVRGALSEGESVTGQRVRLSGCPAADTPLVEHAVHGAGVHAEVAADGVRAVPGEVAVRGGLLIEADGAGERASLLPGPGLDPGPVQRSSDDALIGAVPAGEGMQRLPVPVPGDQLAHRQIHGDGGPHSLGLTADDDPARDQQVLHTPPVGAGRVAQRGEGLTGFVTGDQVVSIKLCSDALHGARPFVYTLETSSGTYSSATTLHKNCRSASWYSMRELLDPALGSTLALPDDDYLTADLTAPGYAPATGGYYVVESKDDIRKRLGRSPDVGDAVAMALWHNPSTAREPDFSPEARRPRARAYASAQFG